MRTNCVTVMVTVMVAVMVMLVQVADHWYPRDSRAQARVDEYLECQHLGTRSLPGIDT